MGNTEHTVVLGTNKEYPSIARGTRHAARGKNEEVL